ncbi:hypothetical protein CEUSTIGMA_g45.t1 [Chlamydomonas eustigma]|uniref:Metalloenzyme domain-containing protein n=1 Tax=Chlamydomonas eustigma TaxID=1157962 RepID=A0A250WPH3_9CHLO|nr:hypothetical protein CEUSTIGMA_g45.t1 [Chlamydomonas eustigma]|eukprot:GAX72589.1 hypothetical protein CEUSTIGMA_g45.t1 [Chlamydomonas eustigma]
MASSKNARLFLVLVDGLGDTSVPALSDRTPLEVAHAPCLDAVAAAGLNGLMDPITLGRAGSSKDIILSILGMAEMMDDDTGISSSSHSAGTDLVPTAPVDILHSTHGISTCAATSSQSVAVALKSLGIPVIEFETLSSAKLSTTLNSGAVVSALCDRLLSNYYSSSLQSSSTLPEAMSASITEEHMCRLGILHVQDVQDASLRQDALHKVRAIEAVDRMVAEAVRRLWEAEEKGCASSFAVVVAGTQSIPVLSGHNSHDPVPFAVAHLRHLVQAMGGRDVIRAIKLSPNNIAVPTATRDYLLANDYEEGRESKRRTLMTGEMKSHNSAGHPMNALSSAHLQDALVTQGVWQDVRRKAAWAGRPWIVGMPAEIFGPYKEPWPQVVRGDPVRSFDEVSAARGSLGRFPASEVMSLMKQFSGIIAM